MTSPRPSPPFVAARGGRLGGNPDKEECFLVTTSNRLVNGEHDRAEAWPAELHDLVGAPA